MNKEENIIPIGTTREWHGVIITMTEDGWRAEVKHNMHRRCRDWDYCKPWIYLITIDTQHHEVAPMPIDVPEFRMPEWLEKLYGKPGHPHLFGELAPALGTDGKPFIELNAFGKAVDAEILGIPHYYPQLRILKHIVMPNHIHMVIHVKERLPEKKPLGFIINKFKSGVNRLYKEILLGLPKETRMHITQQREHPDQSSYGTVKCFPSETKKTKLASSGKLMRGSGSSNPDTGLVFEINFHDRILFRKGQLEIMIAYVVDNPRRLWELIHNRQYFEKIADWCITMAPLPYGGTKNAGRWWQYYPGDPAVLTACVRPALPVSDGKQKHPARLLAPVILGEGTMTMTFNAIGNRSLLDVPERMQIQCSRRASQGDIDALVADTLEACKHGVVPISPCLSTGEKAVARAVMDAGYSLIALFPQGIPPQTDEYKPYGQFFDACARGQLLILSPWEFRPGKKKVERWQCLLLNDIAAQLSVD